uniref:Major facilitator superfamily (MFS) profile domain-containing protein n=1 Tax=Zooxanthella nutricula TaxID=1333877 RepID=A0A7S2N3M5_9DINO
MALLTGALMVCSELQATWMFLAVFLLQQIAWNVVQTSQAGLVPDIVCPEQRGAAGGATAANTLGGALVALLSVRVLGMHSLRIPLRIHYATTCALGIVFCGVVCFAAREHPTDRDGENAPEADRTSFVGRVRVCYSFDFCRYPQYSKLLCSKTIYCASVMIKGFLLFFVQDTFKLRDATQEEAMVSDTAIGAETTAALSAVAAMMFMDAAAAGLIVSKKRDEEAADAGTRPTGTVVGAGASKHDLDEDESLAFAAQPSSAARIAASRSNASRARCWAMAGSLWMSVLWLGPLLTGLGVQRDALSQSRQGLKVDRQALADRWSPIMVLGTAVWGLGQGVYLAGDQALSYALLPNPDEASRLLGLTSICAAVGAASGGAMTGGLLRFFGGGKAQQLESAAGYGPGYGTFGYVAIFSLACVLSGATTCVLHAIRTHPQAREMMP